MHEGTDTGALLGHASELRTLAACLTRNDAADLVQDTWVTALAARDRPRNPGAWLRQVMRNQFRGTLRASARRRAREQHVPHETLAAAHDDDLVHTELVLAMQDALDALADPYRTVVRARFLGGLSPTEIAIEVGVPPATVRWQIHEGLRRIREGLDARYGDRRHWHGGALAIAGWTPAKTKAVTTMTRFAVLKWFAGLTVAGGASAVAMAQWSAPAEAHASIVDGALAPTAARVLGAAPVGIVARDAASSMQAATAAPSEAVDGQCDGECQTDRPFRSVLSDTTALQTAFPACVHLLPTGADTGRFEVEVTVRGGAEDVGNTLTGVSVTRGRKIPCIDPDADFDEPDGPDVVHFDAVAACIQHALPPTFVAPLPDGEEQAMVAVHQLNDAGAAVVAPAPLPEPSAESSAIDPEQAIAHFGLVGTRDPARAKVSVVECGGYDCSFCRKAQATVSELTDRYGDALSFHFLQMPLDMHPTGALAARAAVAAARQGKSWQMHAALFDEPTLRTEAALVEHARTLGLDADRFARDLADPATAQTVADQREVCTAAGARGTPSFFINGDLLVGSQEIEAFTEIIDDELASQK